MRNWIAPILWLVCCIGTANAQVGRRMESPRGFYMALDYDHASATNLDFDGGDVAAGYRFNRFLGLELGVLGSSVSGATISSEYLEAQGFLPIIGGTSLMLSAGGAIATVSESAGSVFAGLAESGYRVGVGFESRFSDHWTFRAAAHYQTALDNVGIFNAGISYRF